MRPSKTSQCLFHLFNYTLLGFGLLILGTGIAIGLIFGDICTDKYSIPLSLGIIIQGAIIITVQLVGCCGSKSMSKCLLVTFTILIFTVIVLGALVTVGFVKFNSQVNEFTQSCLVETINEYNHTKTSQGLIDNLQQKLQCCGVKNKTDWGSIIPESCCKDPSVKNCTGDVKNLFDIGCYEVLLSKLKTFAPLVITVATIVLLLEVVLFVMSCMFIKKQTKEKDDD